MTQSWKSVLRYGADLLFPYYQKVKDQGGEQQRDDTEWKMHEPPGAYIKLELYEVPAAMVTPCVMTASMMSTFEHIFEHVKWFQSDQKGINFRNYKSVPFPDSYKETRPLKTRLHASHWLRPSALRLLGMLHDERTRQRHLSTPVENLLFRYILNCFVHRLSHLAWKYFFFYVIKQDSSQMARTFDQAILQCCTSSNTAMPPTRIKRARR